MNTHKFFINVTLLFFLFLTVNTKFAYCQSIELTESIQYVDIGDLDISGNLITVEAKILLTNPIGNIVSKHTDPSNVNYLLRPTRFEITTENGFYIMQNPFNLDLNKWYHVAGTYDGQYIRYYVNGCLVIENPASGNLVQNNFNTGIGNRTFNFQNQEQFYGQIDEVRIWDICRSESDIKDNMNNLPDPENQDGLVAYYKFDNDLLNSADITNNGVSLGSVQFDDQSLPIFPFDNLEYNILGSNCDNYDLEILSTGIGVEYSLDGINYTQNSIFSLNPGDHTIWARNQEGCILSIDIFLPLEISPTFTQVADICSGDTLTALPTTSDNGITGTWSPALDNTATTTYTFTPDASQCATTISMTIEVSDCSDSYDCNEFYNPDLCYLNEPFGTVDFSIEQKIVSEDEIAIYQSPLLADINGDCIPEIIMQDTNNIDGASASGIKIINSLNGETYTTIPTYNF
jgi:hypothetical protein